MTAMTVFFPLDTARIRLQGGYNEHRPGLTACELDSERRSQRTIYSRLCSFGGWSTYSKFECIRPTNIS